MSKVIITIPCYNEEKALPIVFDELFAIRKKLADSYVLDIMLVNDGSSDDTQSVINELAQNNGFVYYRQFTQNAGHQSALRAGLNVSTDYDAVIMMDADMQHPPKLIPKMLDAWENGAKIVQMLREDSIKETNTFKYLSSRLFYKLLNWLSDLKLEYGASDYRLIDKSITRTLAESRENDLFLRGYFSWLPVSRSTIKYTPSKRVAGKSKYTFRKMMHLAYRSVLQFSEKPLRIAVSIGALIALTSLIYGIYLIAMYFAGQQAISGWTSLMVVILFCFGVNFILLGIIGSYLAHSISIEKQRPEFIIYNQKIPVGLKG